MRMNKDCDIKFRVELKSENHIHPSSALLAAPRFMEKVMGSASPAKRNIVAGPTRGNVNVVIRYILVCV